MLKRVMNSLQPSSSSSSSNPNLQSSTSLASTIQPTDSTSTRRPSTRAMSFASSTTNGGNTTKTSVPKRKYVKVHSKGVKKGNNALGKVFLAQTIDTNAWPTPPPPPSTSSAISQSSSSPRKQNHRHSQSTSPPPPSIQTDSSLQFPAIPRTDSPLSLPPSPSPAPSPTTTLSPPSSPTKPTSSLKTSTPAKRSSSFLRPLRLSRTDSSSTAASTVVTSPTTLNAKDGGARPDAMPPSPTTSSMRKKTSSLSEGGSGTKEATGAGVKGKGKALWCLAWSLDGRYLATAGQDAIVRIYRTLSSDVVPEESVTNISTGAGAGQNGGNAANVVEETPFRVWEGHKDGVLSLSWSKNGFLLTSSMDKTVRLWHTSRENCLTVFQHPDFVTSVTFHPRDDRFFLSGGCDFKVRIWSIVEKKVRHVVEVPEMITAVAFSVDGKTAAAGTFTGKVYFLTDSLAYLRSIKVRSTRGKNSKGKKITNIQFLAASTSGKDERVLITSNDSRVRLYRLNDSALEMKFKGHENESSQIGATIGDDGRWIICGSEDGHVYLWGTDWDVKDREEARYQQFEADPSVVSCAVLAPMNARLLLASSGDEIYASQGPSSYFPPVINLSAAPTRVSLNPTLSRSTTLSIGTLSPRSETDPLPALDTAGTFDSMETYASLPILAIATMHGTVKIYRVDNSIANSAQSLQNRGSVDSLASRGQPGERRASLVPSSRSGH
ncbi:WD40-repeat-containing domain protein [Mrakia frigida]|uniref:WD40 repeat domain-containing protein n=1 Tax=Mrakia frigida TaxID=29902 RepID=UPI003FCBF36C